MKIFAAVPSKAIKKTALLGYVISLLWYGWDLWSVYTAVHKSSPYPFFFNVGNASTFLTFTGSVYWVTFGLDRSGSPASVIGYVIAGVHILVFAVQVWLGPMFWVLNNL